MTGYCPAGYFSKSGWTACQMCVNVPLVDIAFLSPPIQTVMRSQQFQMGIGTYYMLTDMCFRGTLVSNLSFSIAQYIPTAGESYVTIGSPSVVLNNAQNISTAIAASDRLSITFPPRCSINVPAQTMTSNKVYFFQVNMTGQAVMYRTFSSSFVAVQVIATPLVARISGGDRAVYASSGSPPLILDASPSFDPDQSVGTTTYMWQCLRLASQTSCTDPSWEVSTSPTLSVPGSFLVALNNSQGDPVGFNVIVFKDTRNATSSYVRITLLVAPLPSMTISIAVPTRGPSWQRITVNDIVSLNTAIVQVDSTTVPYTLQWTCVSQNMNMTIPTVISSTTSNNLVLSARYLKPGQTFTFMLTLTSSDDPTQTSSSTVSFSVDGLPYNGACSSSPSNGVALQTYFSLGCTGWQLDDSSAGPLQYAFIVTSPSYSILQNFEQTPTLSALLPVGSPVTIQIIVQNIFGSSVTTYVKVNVSNVDVSSPAAVSQVSSVALNAMEQATMTGDVNAAAQVVSAIASVLNSVVITVNASADAATNAAQAEMNEKVVQLRSSLFNSVLNLVSDTVTSTDINKQTQSASVIGSIMSNPAQV
jgi:hypothetical protein